MLDLDSLTSEQVKEMTEDEVLLVAQLLQKKRAFEAARQQLINYFDERDSQNDTSKTIKFPKGKN